MLAVGLEGADREQLRRMVTGEDPRYIYHGGGALAELEGELTDDLCTIISTRVRGWGGEGEQPHGRFSCPGLMQASLVLSAGARAEAKALHRAVPQGEHPHTMLCCTMPYCATGAQWGPGTPSSLMAAAQ